MAHQYDEGPEVAPQNFPEVHQGEHFNSANPSHGGSPHFGYNQPYQTANSPTKNEQGYTPVGASTYGGTTHSSVHHAQADPPSRRSGRGTLCGCTILVFILSCIIALLSAAVLGLAAGTGVEANRANDANNKLATLSSSIASGGTRTTVTATGASATPTPIDNGCATNPSGVTGTKYKTNQLLGSLQFTISCNKDAAGDPLLSLWVADFNTCMDSCAAYTKYATAHFGTTNKNSTCAAVSFIPLWVDKDVATQGGAPGDCYLKGNPQNATTLSTPNIGADCHAAQLTTV